MIDECAAQHRVNQAPRKAGLQPQAARNHHELIPTPTPRTIHDAIAIDGFPFIVVVA